MRVEIDFDNKIIKVEQKCNFKKLMEFIQTLPDWEDYQIDSNTTININTSPITIKEYYPYGRPWYQLYHFTEPILCKGDSTGQVKYIDLASMGKELGYNASLCNNLGKINMKDQEAFNTKHGAEMQGVGLFELEI